MPKSPTRPTQCPSPQWARDLQRWKPRHSCRGGRPEAFPNAKLSRPVIHHRLEIIRWLRNRIAHHEPISTSNNCVYAGHQSYIRLPELVECAEWICLDTAQWLKVQSRYNQAEAILSRVNAMGIT